MAARWRAALAGLLLCAATARGRGPMPGTEDFNDGLSLAAKGWTNVVSAANVAAAGEDGSYALKASSTLGHGSMPISACARSERLQVTWRWYRTSNINTAFLVIDAVGADNGAWGGVPGDHWLFNFIAFGSGLAGQLMSSTDGGINLWSIPNMVHALNTWKTYRVDIRFSSAIDPVGPDGAVLFGPYPGSDPSDPLTPTPGAARDGSVSLYVGNDVSTLALLYTFSGIGIPNPRKTTPPQLAVPYTHLIWTPGGTNAVVDDIVWDDFCPAGPDAPTAPTPSLAAHKQCCDAAGHSGAGDDLLPPVLPGWTPVCGSGGVVPAAAPVTDSEDWDT